MEDITPCRLRVDTGMLTPTKVELGLVSIVPAAPQLNVLDCRLSTRTVRDYMMKLKEGSRRAAASIVGYEGTLAAVARPHLSFDFSGNVT
ncbi:MAG TPA: hypothetical protein VFT63_04560 [bacterium]|nr:hypothetical protein [bacterium]